MVAVVFCFVVSFGIIKKYILKNGFNSANLKRNESITNSVTYFFSSSGIGIIRRFSIILILLFSLSDNLRGSFTVSISPTTQCSCPQNYQLVINVGDVVRSITVTVPNSTSNVTYSSPATAHPFTFTNTGTQLQFVAVGAGTDELHSGNTFTINFSSCITTSTFVFTVNTYGNFDFTTPRTLSGSQPTVSAKFVIPGGPDHICQLTIPSAFTLNGATFTGAATAAWSITNLNPTNGGVNGNLSSTAQTSTPSNVTYTPPANYDGDITLTLTSDATGPCGAVSSTRTLTVNTIPTITGTTPAVRCGTGTVTLGATASAGIINWYSASTGGTSLGTGTSFTTPILSSTTTYYVDATANSCTTSTRTAVIATIAALSDTWIGGTSGFETDWNTGANWSCGVPTATTDVTIPSGRTYYPIIGALNGMCQTITDMANASISGTGFLRIYGNGGVAITNISSNSTISCPVIMPSTGTVAVATSMTLTISGIISGAATNLTMSGPGILVLSGTNTYNGTTIVNSGYLNIQNGSALGTATGGTTVNNLGYLEIQGGITVSAEPLTLTGSGVLLNISGNNFWGGPITISGLTTGIWSAGATLTVTNTINLNSNQLTIQGGAAIVVSGVISNTGSIHKAGQGTLTLSGGNTFSGGVDLNNGQLNINSAAALGIGTLRIIEGNNGNTLKIDNTSATSQAVSNTVYWNDPFLFLGTKPLTFSGSVILGSGVSGTRSVTVNSATNFLTIDGLISEGGGGLGFTKLGIGTLVLTGSGSYTGATILTAGELRLNPATNSTAASQFVLNGAILSTTNITTGRIFTSSSTLQLLDNSTLNLGANEHSIKFANSSGVTWTSGKILTINGWAGNWDGSGGTNGKIFIGNDVTGITTTNTNQLDQIQFFDGTYYFPAAILSTGEIVPGIRTITTGTISGSPFCAGVTGIQVPFTYRRYNSFPTGTATFTAQLSNASGSFASPVNLQNVASNASGSQTISVTIPSGTASGNGYRIRVISDLPTIIGSNNNANLIVYATITASMSGGTSPICYNTSPGTYTATGGGGTGLYTYLWYKDGVSTGITTQTYTPGNLTSSSSFFCEITSGSCGTVSTSTTTATVYPSFTTTIVGGSSPICYNTSPGTFTATGNGGHGTYTYQWYTTSGIISGATSPTYTAGNITATTGYYCAITSEPCGTVNTSTSTITVNINPTITGTLGVCVGSTTQLSGAGTPATPLAWISASPGIATVDNSGLVTGASAGTSVISYTDTNGCIGTATVMVYALPVIVTQPTNQLDCEGHVVSFNVVATGSGLTYTWQRKKPSGSFADIPIEPNVTYPSPGTIRLENVGNSDAPDGTQYRVVISNSDNCSITSSIATLTVNEITGITGPTNVTICQGDNYSYTVSTSYPANVVSYQWKKYDSPEHWLPVTDGGAISGATTDQLIFTGATPSESGKYKVTVVFHSSGADCNVTSDTRDRTLTVNPTPSCTITGSAFVYAVSTGNVYTSTPDPSNNVDHLWSISGKGIISGSTNGATVTVTAAGPGTFTLTDNISRFGCTSSCTYTVSVIDLPCSITPTISVPNGASTTYSAPTGMDTYAWTVVGNGTIPSAITNQQTVTILAGNNCNTYTLTVNITKSGASSTCSQTIAVTDNIPPTFTPEGPFSFCVENLFTATYVSNDVIINPDPDYYLFKAGNTSLDLDPSKYMDNCCVVPADQFTIRWEIVFSTSGEPTISGTGQPSTYAVGGIPTDIKLWGDGITFTSLTHTIRYWLKDCNGNEMVTPIEQNITIKPRPNIIKGN